MIYFQSMFSNVISFLYSILINISLSMCSGVVKRISTMLSMCTAGLHSSVCLYHRGQQNKLSLQPPDSASRESEQEWEIVAGNKTFYSRQPQPPYIKQNNSIITFNLLQQEYSSHSTLENWSLFSLCLQSPPCLQSTNSQCWLPAEVNFQIVYWSWLSDERGIDDGGGIIIHLLHALHDHW